MQVLTWDKGLLKKLPQIKKVSFDKDLFQKIHRILSEVREKGDGALHRFTKEFDGVEVSSQKLRVSEANINAAFEKVDTDFVPILKHISESAEKFYRKDLPKSFRIKERDGVVLAKQYRPLERVGVYIPGGTAPLVSTVYMTVIPAKIAGVKDIVLCSPPNRDTGDIDPHI